MGLDVTYVSKASLLDAVVDAEGRAVDRQTGTPIDAAAICVHVHPDYPGRADDLVDGAFYAHEGDGDSFRAGHYSGVILWRNVLAQIAGYPGYEAGEALGMDYCRDCFEGASGPFSELIHFSESEGVFGTAVSAKLARDFAAFQPQADALDDEDFSELYTEWRKAFETAADGGFVKLH